MENYWIIGCGDIGRRVARRLTDQRVNINALVTSKKSVTTCQSLGIQTIQHDLDTNKALPLPRFANSHIFYFAPPSKLSSADTRLANFLSQVTSQPHRIVLISTTGVYGDCNGQWIDEETPTNPQTTRAQRRISAENLLISWAEEHNREYIILRVPGIYALDRLPLSRLRKKLPIVQASEAAITNRIHADDLANICIQAMRSKLTGEIFNATDGTPSTMVEYFNDIADYTNLPRPEQISLKDANKKLSKGMLSYALESRRISNKKLLKELLITLQYPTLADTLK